jgi:hypothetical protein
MTDPPEMQTPGGIIPATESVGAWLDTVRAEWDAPDHGAYAPLLARLPSLKQEAHELVAEVTHRWPKTPRDDLVGWLTCYADMAVLPWQLFGSVVEGATPAEVGAVARVLFVLRVWWTQRTASDPFAFVFLIYVLAELGPAAARELERRLDRSKNRDLARLAMALGLPDGDRVGEWAQLERLVPGADLAALRCAQADVRDALELTVKGVRGRVGSAQAARLLREEAPERDSPATALTAMYRRTIVEALRGLPLTNLVARARAGTLADTLAARAQQEARDLDTFHRTHALVEPSRLDKMPATESILVSIEQDDTTFLSRLAAAFGEQPAEEERLKPTLYKTLARRFLKDRSNRRHKDGLALAVHHRRATPTALKVLAKRRKISVQALIARRTKALAAFEAWVRTLARSAD